MKAHNFYAPFYSQYIPATARPTDGEPTCYGAAPPSGIDGAVRLGRLPRVPHPGPLYRNWGFAWPTQRATPTRDTTCLFSQVLPGLHEHFRPLPYGYNSVSVYSDESGEANVNYVPGLGMYFDNLAASQQEPQRRL